MAKAELREDPASRKVKRNNPRQRFPLNKRGRCGPLPLHWWQHSHGAIKVTRDAGKCSLQLAVLLWNWSFVTWKEVRKDFGGAIPHYGMDFSATPKLLLLFSHLLPEMYLCFKISIMHSETAHTEQNLHVSPPRPRGDCPITYRASTVPPLPSFFLSALFIFAMSQTLLLWVSNILVGPKCSIF